MSEDESNANSNTKFKDGVNRNARLIVRNISFKATEEDLKKHFSSYGTVEEVTLLKKPDGRLVGCGFVHYTHVPMANKAIAAANKKPFLGRPISVSWAVSKDKYKEQISSEKGPRKKFNSKAAPDDDNDDVQEVKTEDSKPPKDKNEPRINRNARLIVRNVSFKATEKSLKEHFEPYGTIHEVKLLKKPDGKLVGCAFVHYKNVPMAKKALLNTNMKPYLGRPISVDWAVAKDKYMQFVVNKQIEMEDAVKKEESDSDDDNKPPLNISGDELKQEIKSESEGDSAESDDEKDDSAADDDSDDDKDEEDDDDEENEDEDADADDHDDNQSETSTIAERKRIQLNDAEDGCTVFITNIPFSVDNDQLRQFAEQTGAVLYALVCVDRLTEHSKGSGFVKFQNEEDARRFLALGPEELRLEGQALQPRPALKRESLQKANKQPKDNRNLYLVKEGVIVAGTKAALGVSASDMAKRLQLERSKTQMLKNLNRFVSRYRLVVSNLPTHFDDNKLRRVCTSMSDKRAQVTECRVMRDLRALVGSDGKHPSKGYGFVMFTRHEDALGCLRKLNNNPDIFDKNNRPIVSFSIEDRTALNARKKRLEKSILNNPLANNDNNPLASNDGKKRNRKRKHAAPPDESYVKRGRFEKTPKNQAHVGKAGKQNGFNKRRQNQDDAPGKFVRIPADADETEYSGLTAKEGTQHKMRSFHKLKTQADIHRQNVKLEKKTGQKSRKLKLAAKERVKQPKQRINKNPNKKRRRPNRNANAIR